MRAQRTVRAENGGALVTIHVRPSTPRVELSIEIYVDGCHGRLTIQPEWGEAHELLQRLESAVRAARELL